MRSLKKQQGYTLVELALASVVIAIMAIAYVNFTVQQTQEEQAAYLAQLVAQYNNAVRARIAKEPTLATATYTGTGWLQPASCGGTAPEEYLPCSFPDTPRGFKGLTWETVVTRSGSVTEGVTQVGPIRARGEQRGDLASIVAFYAGGARSGSLDPLGGTFGLITADLSTAMVVATATNNANTDAWLRTDGSNEMNADLTFNSSVAAANRDINNANWVRANYVRAESNMRARLYYDLDNTSYYVNPAGTSIQNTVRANIFQDLGDTNFYVNPNGVSMLNDLRASIIYDRDNTNYYINLNSTGRSIRTAGEIYSDSQVEGSTLRARNHAYIDRHIYMDDPGGTVNHYIFGEDGGRGRPNVFFVAYDGSLRLNYYEGGDVYIGNGNSSSGGDLYVGNGSNRKNLYVNDVYVRSLGNQWLSNIVADLEARDGGMAFVNSVRVNANETVTKPNCVVGTPKIFVIPQRINTIDDEARANLRTTTAFYAIDGGSYWRVRARGYVDGRSPYTVMGSALVLLACDF